MRQQLQPGPSHVGICGMHIWRRCVWEGSPADHTETVLRILETHPAFLEFYGGLHWRTISVQFQFDTRRVYRHRLKPIPQGGNLSNQKASKVEEEKFAMGLWPLILERANRLVLSDVRRSRALYWLLHQGPAFCALPVKGHQ